jgi:hypothetical protein
MRILVLSMTLVLALSAVAQTAQTTLKDQTDLAITAYNNNLALVRDTRTVQLPTGTVELQFADVAEMIKPETVSLQSLTDAGSIDILEQNYEFDLMSPEKLMEKYVGQQVELVNYNQEIGFERIQAELLSNNNGPIYRIGDKIYLGHPGHVAVSKVPENLIAKPSLLWLVDNNQAQQILQATYLTEGVNWKADYVVVYTEAEGLLDLNGWVTLMNQSGATYTNAKLKLVAGEVHRAPEYDMFFAKAAPERAMDSGGGMPMEQEAFGEYHLYTLPRRATIKQNQSKQVALLNAESVSVEKLYQLEVHQGMGRGGREEDRHVGVYLEFENAEANKMGMPLPAGIVRVYQEDSEGMLQFAGEDRIQHTPKDEDVKVMLGEAFDVVADVAMMDYQQLSEQLYEAAYQIDLRNHKETDVTVKVIQKMPLDWEVLDSSHEGEKEDARTLAFHVPVPTEGKATLTFRVRVQQ